MPLLMYDLLFVIDLYHDGTRTTARKVPHDQLMQPRAHFKWWRETYQWYQRLQ